MKLISYQRFMKKILLNCSLLLLAILSFQSAKAQPGTIDLFCEDFDTTATNWGMITYTIPTTTQPGFERDTVVTFRGSKGAATDTVGFNSVALRAKTYIQTPNLGIQNYNNVTVQFSHIGYISQFDEMRLQYSFDGGTTWANCGANEYTGTSTLLVPGNYFNKTSRALLWKFADAGGLNNDTSFLWNATNSSQAWITEDWNIRQLISTRLPTPDSVMFRIELLDGGEIGRVGTHRYYLDDFCVRASNCEAIPPNIARFDTMIYSPTRYTDRVYWLGPYEFNTQLIDASTISQAFVRYRISREVNGIRQTLGPFDLPLNQVGATSFYNNEIPFGTTQIGDSVYWKIFVYDGSPCRNETLLPPGEGIYNSFEVRSNRPKSCRTDVRFNYPYYQTFDQFPAPMGQFTQIQGWVNSEGDFHDWQGNLGTTSTSGTGPSDDLPGGGTYLFVEATGFPDSTAVLLSPCFDLFDLPNGLVRFYLHQNTSGGDTVFVDVFDPTPVAGFPDGRFIENVISPVSGNKGDNWLPYEFSTYQFGRSIIQLRFRGVPDKLSEISDIGLDSFKIQPAPLEDMRIDQVVLPPYMPVGEQVDVDLVALNQGVSNVTALEFNYDIILAKNDSIVDSVRNFQWTGNIAPGATQSVTITDQYTVPRGQYFVKAWLKYVNDEVLPNDTANQGTRGLVYEQIYFRDFFDDKDSVFTVLTDESDTLFNFWEHGEPNYDKTNRAFTLPYAWDINLDRPYVGAGATVQLISPFLDFSNAQDVFLSFFNNRDMDTAKDGVYIQYSLDQGLTWDSVTSLHDPGRLKWYNSALAAPGFGGTPVFSGVTRYIENNWHNWLESEIMLPTVFDNEPLVLLRFLFYSEDAQQANDGMSIDNFLVYDRKPLDVEPQYLMRPKSECDMTSTERFRVAFKNRGEQTFNSFDVEYVVTNLESGNEQRQTETVNRPINPRDTIWYQSPLTFDMRELGDYEVKVITQLQNDGYAINDTLTQIVENIDGCYLMFEAVTGAYKRPARVDSSFWRFEYTSRGRDYVITDDYQPFDPVTVNERLICIRKNSFVKFSLGDQDTAIVEYSLYAYDGEEDTIIVNKAIGGTATPTQFFNWVCPPDSSAETIEILIDNNAVQFPIAKQYNIASIIGNDGLDSIATLEVGVSIDGIVDKRIETFDPPLEYNEKDTMNFGMKYLGPGRHLIKAWVHQPNGNQDEIPSNDTISRTFVVIDTSEYGFTRLDSNGNAVTIDPGDRDGFIYCTDFENPDDTLTWIGLDFLTTYQDETVSFEWATPNNTVLNGAFSGNKAWVTDADSSFRLFDNSTLLSPFIPLQKDSCYQVSFYHNYEFSDEFNDGAQLRFSNDTGATWTTLNAKAIGVGDTLIQEGWYNATNIVAIPNNSENAGWTGFSNGWKRAQSVLPAYEDGFTLLAFRMGSDGNQNSEGWAIDNFCIERIANNVSQRCFAVGLNEEEIDPNKMYLGQNQPNPAMGQAQIPFYLPEPAEVNFTVTNMLGQTVYEENMTKSSGNHLLNLDVQDFDSGIYYYWILVDEVKIAKKMIITH